MYRYLCCVQCPDLESKGSRGSFFNQSIISGKAHPLHLQSWLLWAEVPVLAICKKLLHSCLLFWRLYALLLGIMQVAGFTCPQVALWLEQYSFLAFLLRLSMEIQVFKKIVLYESSRGIIKRKNGMEIDNMSNVLIVIDMQNDFVTGSLGNKDAGS